MPERIERKNMKNPLISAVVGIAITLAASPPSMAETWKYAGDGHDTKAYVHSINKATSIAIGCDRAGLYFDLYFLSGLSGWQPNVDVSLVVGEQTFPVVYLDGGSDYARFFTHPNGADGVSEALLSAMASGNTLTLGGAAAARMKAQSRTYSLKGSAAAIRSIRNRCG